jgi:hypothetical protein
MLRSKPVVASWAELSPRAEGVRPGARVLLFRTVRAALRGSAGRREGQEPPHAPALCRSKARRGSDGHHGAERDGGDVPPRRPGRAEAPSAETEADEEPRTAQRLNPGAGRWRIPGPSAAVIRERCGEATPVASSCGPQHGRPAVGDRDIGAVRIRQVVLHTVRTAR